MAQNRIDWDAVHERLRSSQLALQHASKPDPDKLQAIYHRRRVQLANRESRATTQKQVPVLTFYLEDERYAIALYHLSEVVRFGHCAQLPNAPSQMVGVVNLQGTIRPVADLARMLDLSNDNQAGYILFFQERISKVGLTVDRVDQVDAITPEDMLVPESGQTHLPTRYVKGLMPDGLIVLDFDALMTHPIFEEGKLQ